VLAAVALLFVMATDWYSSPEGDELRRIERLAEPDDSLGPEASDLGRQQREQASQSAEAEERNAWTADGLIDRVILLALLAAIAAAVSLAVSAVRERSLGVPGGARGLALIAATFASMLVAYRIVQEPGIDAVTTIRGGPFLALVALGLMALGAILTLRGGGVQVASDGAVIQGEAGERQVATAAGRDQRAGASGPVEPAGVAGPVIEAPAASTAPEAEMPPPGEAEAEMRPAPEAEMPPASESEAETPPAPGPAEAGGSPSGLPHGEAHAPPTAAPSDALNGAAPVSYRRRFSADQRARIAEIARSDPSASGKPYARWTHARLATHLVEEGVVDSISPGTVGRILRQEGVSGDPASHN